MSISAAMAEHLTPHDLVTYSRCPYEMDLARARRASLVSGSTVTVAAPPDVVPLLHSPLRPPPVFGHRTYEGPPDIAPTDVLVYQDEHERGLPVLFPPERVRLDPRYSGPRSTLIDPILGLSGRPDFVVQRGNSSFFPVEFKSTHLFQGSSSVHGRLFDVIQVIAECRLVETAFGCMPAMGLVYYGDAAGNGLHEGWVEVSYGSAEAGWLEMALGQIRADRVRAPVPSEAHCTRCDMNRDKVCRFASVPFASVARNESRVPTF